jgi:hypothetical protein
MVSGLTRNQVPGNRLRVRIPCPPLRSYPQAQVATKAVLAPTHLIDTVQWVNSWGNHASAQQLSAARHLQ